MSKCRYCGSSCYGSGCIHSPTGVVKLTQAMGGGKTYNMLALAALVICEPYAGGGLNPELTAFFENAPHKNRVLFLTGARKSLMPEERWWLYTQTAAAPRGWKKALGYALAERAVQSYVQGETF